MHDSVAFDGVYEELIEEHEEKIENVCLDAGYNTPAICKKIEETRKIGLMPYTRPKGRKDKEVFSKKDMNIIKN